MIDTARRHLPEILEDVMRVLLIGQDAATAASVKMMLIRENFICDTVDFSEGGVEVGKLHDYDVILLDLSVPNINGYGVLRRLRRGRLRTPVLIFLGNAELDHRIKDLGFSDEDFLTKPLDHGELIARIQAIHHDSQAPGALGKWNVAAIEIGGQ